MPKTSSATNKAYQQQFELSVQGDFGISDNFEDNFEQFGFNEKDLDTSLESLSIQPLELKRQHGKIFSTKSPTQLISL